MLIHPDLMLTLVNDRHRELIEHSARERLLSSAREARESRRARKALAHGKQATGNLASCEQSAAVPAR